MWHRCGTNEYITMNDILADVAFNKPSNALPWLAPSYAKELNLDAIHDTVHEMARDEARHGKAFEGLLNRYFG